jgi:fatty-acid desaturase
MRLTGGDMAKKNSSTGRLTNWWDAKRDKHLRILSTAFASLMLLISICLYQILLLQEGEWADYTGYSWGGLVIASGFAIWIGPEFFHYIGQRSYLLDVLTIESRSEFEKVRSEAEDAARTLGSPAKEKLNEHLNSLGLKKMRR